MSKAFKYGDDVNTDVLIPARYMNTASPDELAKHALEDLDRNFVSQVKKGDVIVAGENFGSGSSREHAPVAIKASGVSAVIAKSFARIFYRNAFNIGLPILESAEASEKIEKSDEIEIDFENGKIKNITKNEIYEAIPFPEFMQKLISAGGLAGFAKELKK